MDGLTLKEQAYLKIQRSILSGELKPGTFLTERELTEKLGMSRTPIRSALVKLEADGLISNTPNKGPMVADISIDKALDIYDLRIALETHVIRRMSGVNLSDQDKEYFQMILSEQKKALDKKHFVRFNELDTAFHKKIINLYRNKEIIKAFERIQNQYTMLTLKLFEANSKDLTRFYEDHVKIFDLLIDNQTEECTNLIVEHLEFGRTFYFSSKVFYQYHT